jgi:predicted enzyme related to lactoylglutathione lyase
VPNPVTHFEVVGKDGKKLQDFYTQVFSWQIDANNPMGYGMVSSQDGQGIGGGISGGPDGQGGGVTFYVEVADLDATLKKVEQAGGKTIMSPDDVPGGPRLAQFTDPEGHRIGLIQSGSMQGGSQN